MTTASERLLQRLRNVKQQTGAGQWLASCPGPAHKNGDRHPSLSVRQVEGQVLLHCFAGDSTQEVLDALGWKFQDLYDNQRGQNYVYLNLDKTRNRTIIRKQRPDGKRTSFKKATKTSPLSCTDSQKLLRRSKMDERFT